MLQRGACSGDPERRGRGLGKTGKGEAGRADARAGGVPGGREEDRRAPQQRLGGLEAPGALLRRLRGGKQAAAHLALGEG